MRQIRHEQQLAALPAGKAGIAKTLDYMRTYVDQDKTSQQVRDLALSLIAHLPQKDDVGQVRALFDYVKYHIRYVRDVTGVETIQSPIITLQKAAGDCDDKATLLASLLESIGYRTRLHAMGFKPGDFCHVSTEVSVNGRWINLDPTEPRPMGWKPPGIVESLYNETGGLTYDQNGLASLDGLFSKIWGGVKKVGRVVDKAVVRKITKPLHPIVKQKWFGQVGSVVSFIGPWGRAIGTGMTLANKAAMVSDADSRARKIANTANAEQRAAYLAVYGVDEATGEFFNVNDRPGYTGVRFKVDPVKNLMYPIDANGNPADLDSQGNIITVTPPPKTFSPWVALGVGGVIVFGIYLYRRSH